MTLLALAGVFLILAFLLRTRKVKLTTHQPPAADCSWP